MRRLLRRSGREESLKARVDGGGTGGEGRYKRVAWCPGFVVGAESHGRRTRNLFAAGGGG
ncbi:hypothetical protein GCM10010495_49770 [Kitasatospora herbaricolor]|nr:hypothetical protein GCM10010495_49770 [Kitasatospora herbaricolor]